MAKKKPAEPIVEALAIAVPPERAWEALTSPRVLGDVVMGHVEIDPRPGQPFVWQWDVWRRAAPGKHSGVWRGKVLDVVPGSTLVLAGGASSAVLTVKGQGQASLVTAMHLTASAQSTEDYRYGWADFLLKLKTLLEPPAIPNSIYVRMLIRGTPAAILRAWVSPAAMGKILPGKVKIKAMPGGRFEWRWKRPVGRVSTGTILEIEKGRRVAFTWEAGPRPSEVRLGATATSYGALVSLEHIGSHGARRRDVERMWAHLLERLRVYFYCGKKIRST